MRCNRIATKSRSTHAELLMQCGMFIIDEAMTAGLKNVMAIQELREDLWCSRRTSMQPMATDRSSGVEVVCASSLASSHRQRPSHPAPTGRRRSQHGSQTLRSGRALLHTQRAPHACDFFVRDSLFLGSLNLNGACRCDADEGLQHRELVLQMRQADDPDFDHLIQRVATNTLELDPTLDRRMNPPTNATFGHLDKAARGVRIRASDIAHTTHRDQAIDFAHPDLALTGSTQSCRSAMLCVRNVWVSIIKDRVQERGRALPNPPAQG